MTEEEFKHVKELWTLTYAKGALQQAIDATKYILCHKVSINHPLYNLLIVTIFTSYARPFSQSRDFPRLSTNLLSKEQLAFHKKAVIAFRDQLFAHSDALAMVSATHGPILQVKCNFAVGKQPHPTPSLLKLPQQKLKLLLKFFKSVRERIDGRSASIMNFFAKDKPATDGEYILNVYDQSKSVWLSLAEVKQIPIPMAITLDTVDVPSE